LHLFSVAKNPVLQHGDEGDENHAVALAKEDFGYGGIARETMA